MSEMTDHTIVKRDLKELLTLSWPVVLSRLGIMTMGVVDIVVVSRYSTKELGFQALGWAVTACVLTTAVGLLNGVVVMTARHIGEGRREMTGGVYRRGLVYALWLGGLAGIGLHLFGGLMLHHTGLEPELADGATKVLEVLAWSMPFHLLSTTSSLYLEGLARPKPGMIAMWLANIVNLAFNLVLVPGAFGLEPMGAVGAAWSTFGSRVLLTIGLLIYVARMKDARALGIFNKPIDGPEAARQQRQIGYGGGASQFVEAGAFAGMNFVAGWVGAITVSGWALVLNFTALIFMAPLGLSAATGVLVGRAYGAKDRKTMIRAAMLGVGVTVAALAVVSIIVAAIPGVIAGLYSRDAYLISIASPMIALCSLFLIADGLQVVTAQALRSRGDVLAPTLTHIVSYAVVMCPLAWWLALPMGMGLAGIMWAVIAASLLAATLLLGRFWMLAGRL
jgi:MATE family multidrug resistance protein